MSESDLPIMPFFVKDWIAATQHWPGAERGAYISLLAFQWVNGHVPQDVSQLARLTGFTEPDFERLWCTVGQKFDLDDGRLFNSRLEEHRKKALQLRDARTLGATLANQKRRAQRVARRDAERGSTDVPREDAERTHTSTSTYLSSEEEKEKKPRARSARAQRVSRGTNDDFYDEGFLRFKLAMPMRTGGQKWRATKKAWNARREEGYSEDVIVAGTERYNAFTEAMVPDKQYVMQAVTFLGPEKHFLADWNIPADAANGERWSPPSEDQVDPP